MRYAPHRVNLFGIHESLPRALGWLISRNRRLRDRFAEDHCAVTLGDSRVEIAPNCGNARVEFEIRDPRHLIFFTTETDLRTIVPVQQRVYLEADGRRPVTAVLARRRIAPHPELQQILWRDVHGTLATYRDLCETEWRGLLGQYLEHLEGTGMAFTGLHEADVETASRMETLYARVGQLLEEALAEAGMKTTPLGDWGSFRGGYAEDPAKSWVGVRFWGAGVGDVHFGLESSDPAVLTRLDAAGFGTDANWGLGWRIANLRFAAYAHLAPPAQVTKIAAFLQQTAEVMR